LKIEKKFQKNLHWVITLSTHILVTSTISETPCIYIFLAVWKVLDNKCAFNKILGGNKQQKNSKSSLTLPVTKTKERTSSGPFPTKG